MSAAGNSGIGQSLSALPAGYDKAVYYVTCEKAMVNPLALRLKISNSTALWNDTGRGKEIEIAACKVQNSEITLEDKRGIVYKLVPLTVSIFKAFVKDHVAGPVPDFKTDEELSEFYRNLNI